MKLLRGILPMNIRRMISIGAVVIMVAFMLFPAHAYTSETSQVVGHSVQESAGELFVSSPGDMVEPVVKISAEVVGIESYGNVRQDKIPVDTLFLIDISTSIQSADQTRIFALLESFLSRKQENSRYALMTFGETNQLLCDFTDDRYEFKHAIESLAFQEQGSGFYTAVREAITWLQAEKAFGTFAQIVVITDGVELDASGITQNELFGQLSQNALPIHTYGCPHSNNTEELKTLYAIARTSGGISLPLDDETTALEQAQSLWEFEERIGYLRFTIPLEMQDGGLKTVGVFLNNRSEADLLYDLRMPMTTKPESSSQSEMVPVPPVVSVPEEPEPVSAPEPEPQPKPTSVWIWVLIGCAVLLCVGVTAFLIYRQKRKKSVNTSEQSIEPVDPSQEGTRGDTEFYRSGDTQMLVREMGGAGTILLVGVQNPYSRFEISLDNSVIVGRNANVCNIVINTDKSVSGKHCKIYGHGTEVYIEDLDSTNHTFVNGERTEGSVRLHPGDVLKFGRIEYEIHFTE